MPHNLQVFRLRQAFLPYAVTAAAGLPQHVAHADVLIVAARKPDAATIATRVHLDLGKRLHHLRRADVRDTRAVFRLNLLGAPALLAHPDLDRYDDGHLVVVHPNGVVSQVCTLAQLRHLREALRVAAPS